MIIHYAYAASPSALPVTTPTFIPTESWFSSVVMIALVSVVVVLILLVIIASTATIILCVAVYRRKRITTEHIYETVNGPHVVMTALPPHGVSTTLTQSSANGELPDVISQNKAYSMRTNLTADDRHTTYINIIPDVRTLDSALVFASGGSTLPDIIVTQNSAIDN